MNTLKPHTEKSASPSPLIGIAGAIFDGVMSGLGTVVGAVEGTLGIGHTPATTEKTVPPSGPVQAVQTGPKTATARRAPLPNQPKSRSVKSKALKPQKEKKSRAKETPSKALSKSKALRHK